jgi:NIPSNAP
MMRCVMVVVATMALGIAVRCRAAEDSGSSSAGMVYELRTYTTAPGKLDDLNKRFRDHTMQLFEKHGMKNVAYFVPLDKPDTLVYIIAHKSRQAAAASWKAFRADPEWQQVAKESEKNGKIVLKVVSVYLKPTDYSPLK